MNLRGAKPVTDNAIKKFICITKNYHLRLLKHLWIGLVQVVIIN